jgi:hypothetical protein
MMGECSRARKFDSRVKREAGPAAAEVVRTIRSTHLIAKGEERIVAKVTSVRMGVTLFAVAL